VNELPLKDFSFHYAVVKVLSGFVRNQQAAFQQRADVYQTLRFEIKAEASVSGG